jgi:hypothetical protein
MPLTFRTTNNSYALGSYSYLLPPPIVLPSVINTVYNTLAGSSNITFSYNGQNSNICCDRSGQYMYVTQQIGAGSGIYVYYSYNNGATFSLVYTATDNNMGWYSQIACDSTGKYVWFTGCNSFAWYSQNGGTTSNPTFTKLPTPNCYPVGISVSSDGTKVVLCGGSGASYCTNGTSGTPTFTASTGSFGSASINYSYNTSSSSLQYIYFSSARYTSGSGSYTT